MKTGLLKFYLQHNTLFTLRDNQHDICIFSLYLFPFPFRFPFQKHFLNCAHHDRMLFTVKTVMTSMFLQQEDTAVWWNENHFKLICISEKILVFLV